MSRSVDGRKVAEWRGRFERFRRGGLSVARFCAGERVSVPSFYQWRKKLAAFSSTANRASAHAGLANAAVPPSAVAVSFAPVRLVGSASLAAWLPGGTRLEIPLSDVRALQLAIEALVRADGERSVRGEAVPATGRRSESAGGASC